MSLKDLFEIGPEAGSSVGVIFAIPKSRQQRIAAGGAPCGIVGCSISLLDRLFRKRKASGPVLRDGSSIVKPGLKLFVRVEFA